MGIVYVVYDHEWREPYAAKTFQEGILSRNPVIADRFTQEAIAWVNLDLHLNIAQARFLENIDGKPFLFLEYVSGGNLGGWIGTPRLLEDIPQILRFSIQLCDGMTHAVSKGVKAHCDIKPQNCLITEDRTLKVTDFGLSRSFQANGSMRSEMVAGTPPYMAPEQFVSGNQLDVRSDVYSFGVMLFQMLTGRLPFLGRTWQEFALLHKTECPLLTDIQEPALKAVLDQCLAKESRDRFGDFTVLRPHLAKIYETLTSEVVPPPPTGTELNSVLWNNKGVSLGKLGRHQDQLACSERALELNPLYATAWSSKGAALGAALGRWEEAITCYDRALELSPREAKVWTNKGAALAALKRPVEALACYDRALALNPLDEGAWSNEGNTLATLGQTENAIACQERALALNPSYAEGWANKGAILGNLGRHQEAISCYETALDINPRHDGAWFNKGAALGQLGHHKDAVVCYDRAISFNPRYRQAWNNKGAALMSLGQYEEAVLCYDRALQMSPDYPPGWFNKGTALTALHRDREALACFKEAHRLGVGRASAEIQRCEETLGILACAADSANEFERRSDPEFIRSCSLLQRGHPEEALSLLERVLAIQPEFPDALCAKGQALGMLARLPEAIDCFDQAIRIDPCHSESWAKRGVAYGRLGQHDQALESFDCSLKLESRAAYVWRNKASALNAIGRAEEELECLTRALGLEPDNEEALFNKGNALFQLGKFADAVACYERLLELNPAHASAAHNRRVASVHHRANADLG
jgi:tetratricopeptide (TPR) repeat protein